MPQATRDRLARMKYVDAVLWLAARIADGLQHAHEQGLIHRDLKPANILLSDDGQPMLLDFNLAVESENIQKVAVGGTVAYLAPEQLAAVQTGQKQKITERCDFYGLGIILYELLTGHHPFQQPTRGQSLIPSMLEERKAGPPPLRKHNRQVTPAIEAIVRHLLESDPDRRYASAAHVATDLDRQMQNLPLPMPRNHPRWNGRASGSGEIPEHFRSLA